MNNQIHDRRSLGDRSITQRIFGAIFPKSVFNVRVAAVLFLMLSFLLPVFILPGTNFGLSFSKAIFFQFTVLLSAVLLIGAYLRDQTLSFPRSAIFYASWIALLFFVLAGAFSPVPRISFFGIGGEIGTVVMIVLSFAALCISGIVFNSVWRLRSLIIALAGSSILLLASYAVPGSNSMYVKGIQSLAGSYHDFAILLGVLIIIALSVLYFYREKKSLRFWGYIGVFLPFPLLVAVNYSLVWYVLTLVLSVWLFVIMSDIAHVLRVVNNRRSWLGAYLIALTRVPRTAIIVFVLALAFSFGAGNISLGAATVTERMQQFTRIDPIPSPHLSLWETASIARRALNDSPVFGVGPNRFADAFLRYKDTAFNVTPVWDKVFDQGFGFFPTLVVTSGLVGAAVLLYFLGAFFAASRYLRRALTAARSVGFIVVTLYTISAFLLLFVVFGTPGVSVLGLLFISIGGYLAALSVAGLVQSVVINATYKGSNIMLTAMAFIKLLGIIIITFVLAREIMAFRHYRMGQLLALDGDVVGARSEIFKAHQLFPSDAYARDISVLALLELDKTKRLSVASKDEVMKRAFELIQVATVSSDEAVRLNPTKSRNYVQKGASYEALATLGVVSAYGPATDAYSAALLRDPTSPDVMYYAGRTALANGDQQGATAWFRKALSTRPSHKPSLAALMQILMSSNDSEGVRALLIRAVESEQNDPSTRYALGKFYYDEASFGEAAKQFAAALRSNAQHADARFYLAASAYRMGEKDFALQQLRIVQQSNSRHELLNQVISAIEQGSDPFGENIYGTQNN
ncbi:MAG TPA: hypothetical protein VJ579_03670 [Candidatus Paceibacterota bacterium]|nr:hypothetical protein [Candidatus Paceibacterota bacterium]